MQQKRPTRVTVISWILIVQAVLAAFGLGFGLKLPEMQKYIAASGKPLWFHVTFSLIPLVAGLIAGVAMLNRKNWGRLLYLIKVPLVVAIGAISTSFSPMQIPAIIFYIVLSTLLFTGPSPAYFSKSSVEPNFGNGEI